MHFLRKTKLVLAALLMTLTLSFGYATLAHATAKDNVCDGVALTGGSSDCGAGSGESQVGSIIKTLIQILGIIAGIAAVIMIIVAGLKYITSGGEASNLSSAKNSLVYALIGMVIVALSQVIVHYVLGKV